MSNRLAKSFGVYMLGVVFIYFGIKDAHNIDNI